MGTIKTAKCCLPENASKLHLGVFPWKPKIPLVPRLWEYLSARPLWRAVTHFRNLWCDSCILNRFYSAENVAIQVTKKKNIFKFANSCYWNMLLSERILRSRLHNYFNYLLNTAIISVPSKSQSDLILLSFCSLGLQYHN